MSWPPLAEGRPEEGRHIARIGFDDSSTMVVPAASAASAAVFPTTQVGRAGAVESNLFRDLSYSVVFITFAAGAATPKSIASWFGFEREGTAMLAIGMVLGGAALALAAFIVARMANWQMFVALAALACFFGLQTDLSFGNGILVPLIFLGVAEGVRRSRKVRLAKWHLIKPIVADHTLVEASIIGRTWSRIKDDGSVLLTVAAPLYPGRVWSGQLKLSTFDAELAPEVGDSILIFVCPSRPDVAVLRPVIDDGIRR